MEKKKPTTASGKPYYEFENSMSAGKRGLLSYPNYLTYH